MVQTAKFHAMSRLSRFLTLSHHKMPLKVKTIFLLLITKLLLLLVKHQKKLLFNWDKNFSQVRRMKKKKKHWMKNLKRKFASSKLWFMVQSQKVSRYQRRMPVSFLLNKLISNLPARRNINNLSTLLFHRRVALGAINSSKQSCSVHKLMSTTS